MLKLSFLATALLGAAFMAVNGTGETAGARVAACSVDSRGEAIQWGLENPGVSYVMACRQTQR